VLDDVVIFAIGIFAWSFIEYLIHAWLSHTFDTFATPLHNVHHQDPRAVFAVGAWIPIAIIWLMGLALFGSVPGMIFLTGIVSGFVVYEAVHYRIHFHDPRGAWETRLRTRHIIHHHRNPQVCFGVTSELWDLIFGTEPMGAEMNRHRESVTAIPRLAGPTNLRKIISYLPLRLRPG
jgi:sterol desaturase/sphingolipid hydroxylase (fatty acid hydroxylase superfamily)